MRTLLLLRPRALLGAAVLVLACAACGQKGPLFRAEPASVPAAAPATAPPADAEEDEDRAKDDGARR